MKKIILSALLLTTALSFIACNENVMKCNSAQSAYIEEQKECDVEEDNYIDLDCDAFSDEEYNNKDCTNLFNFYEKAECTSFLGTKVVAGNLEELPICVEIEE